MTGPGKGDRVVIIDSDNMVHRLYHAVPPTTSPSGHEVNAVIGWVRSLRRFYQDGARWVLPVFDGPGNGWRHDLHPGYKAHRRDDDDALASQWELVVRATIALRLPPLAWPETEADDLIATYTKALRARGCEVVIASNDKDLLQLVGPGVRVLSRVKGVLAERGPEYVRERWGVEPGMLGDLLALMGDTSDGVPGISGIGPVTAAKILRDHGSLEAALDRWMLVQGKAGEALRDGAEVARMSRRLVTLQEDTPLPLGLDELTPWVPSRAGLDAFFGSLGWPRFESALDPARE